MPPSPSRLSRDTAPALGVAAGLSFVAAVTTALSYLWPETAPLPLLVVLGVAVALRARMGERERLGLMGGVVMATATPSLAAVFGLPDAVVYGHWRCGTGDIAALFVLPFLAAFGTFLGSVLAWALAKPLGGLARLAPFAAAPVLLLGLLLAGKAASTVSRPSPDAWLAALPTVGVIPDVAPNALCIPLPPFVVPEAEGPVVPTRCTMGITEIAGLEVERQCPIDRSGLLGCDVHINGDFVAGLDSDHREIELRAAGERVVPFVNETPRGAALPGVRGVHDITLRELASELDTAKHFLPAALLGLMLAGLLTLGAARALFARRALTGFEDATLDESGWIELADGRTIRANLGAFPPPGQIHVVGAPGAQDYRDARSRTLQVHGGTVEAARERHTREVRALATAAIAASIVGLGPLLLALWTGHVSLG